MSLTFLLGLLVAVLIAVAFGHLAIKPLFFFACFYFILLFSRAVAIAFSPLYGGSTLEVRRKYG